MADKPHILILMPDQQRADSLGCAGHPQARTPNIDRIANEGVRFTECTTVSPVCMPARASFISGLYPHNHGVWSNRGSLPAEDETFFRHLQRTGYHTAHIGKSHYYPHVGWEGDKWHMKNHEEYMRARGFDTVNEVTGPLATQRMQSYMTDELEAHGLLQAFRDDYAERGRQRGNNPFLVQESPIPVEYALDSYVGRSAAQFVDGYGEDKPLCMFVGFPGPHEPWDAPGDYATMYNPADTPPPIPWPEANRDLPESVRDMEDFQPHGSSTPENIARVRANYYGKISLIDHWVGEIFAAYERQGMMDDLVVLYWSDHGELLGDHRRVYKSTFHETSVRVPLIVRAPGRCNAGAASAALAEITDIFPTILELAGAKASSRALGTSLVPVLEHPEADLRDTQLSEIQTGHERRIMLRTRDHKYAVRENGDGFMLYDLSRDPDEQENRIGRGDSLETSLRDALLRRLVDAQYSM